MYDHQPSMEELSASGKKRLAFMDLLFSIRDEYKLTDEDIRGQVDMFMAAGMTYSLIFSKNLSTPQKFCKLGLLLFYISKSQHNSHFNVVARKSDTNQKKVYWLKA